MKKIFPASSPGTDILPQLNSSCKNDSHSHSRLNIWESPQKSPHRQLPLFNSPQPAQAYPLTIEALPDALQWWNETRYWLIHKDFGLRVSWKF
jgi:hypothetical protein